LRDSPKREVAKGIRRRRRRKTLNPTFMVVSSSLSSSSSSSSSAKLLSQPFFTKVASLLCSGDTLPLPLFLPSSSSPLSLEQKLKRAQH